MKDRREKLKERIVEIIQSYDDCDELSNTSYDTWYGAAERILQEIEK